MNTDATVVGTIVGGVLLFASSILVPFITKRANKADSAAEAARRSAETAESFTTTAKELVDGVKAQLTDTRRKCDRCLNELHAIKRKEQRRDRSLDAVHAALLEIVPLLPANSQETSMLRAAIRAVARTRYNIDEDDVG